MMELSEQEVEDFVKERVKKWDGEATERQKRNLRRYLQSEKLFNLERNDELLAERELFDHDQFPSGKSNNNKGLTNLGILIGLWERECTNEELSNISGQVARPCMTLRDIGFVFKKDEKSKNKRNWTFKKGNKEYRKIVGFEPRPLYKNYWNRLTSKEKKLFKAAWKEDILSSCTTRRSEIDHRTPELIRKTRGDKPILLTGESIVDGSCYEHFQILSCSTNNIKREACSSCQRGNQISLPPCARLSEEAYKKYYNEDDNGCIGCFWHNYLGPKNPGYFPNLKEEIEKENKIRKELSVKVKKLKRKRKKSEDLF